MMHLFFSPLKLEKNKIHIQQLEGDIVKCREQVTNSEEECRAAQRELKRLQMASNDQRDALANEVNLCQTIKRDFKNESVNSVLRQQFSWTTLSKGEGAMRLTLYGPRGDGF